MMGSEDNDKEKPIHSVTVKDFYMSKTEVTVEQYEKCVEAGVCSEPEERKGCNWNEWFKESHPINCVDWIQARRFARWVGGDLPSEAQWEYAARSGGRNIKYPMGHVEDICQYGVYERYGCGKDRTWEVCTGGDNTIHKLCDMGGNVWEWVLDEWHDSYNKAPSYDIAWCSNRKCESNTSTNHVGRGVSWYYNSSNLPRSRYSRLSGSRNVSVGFRVSDIVY